MRFLIFGILLLAMLIFACFTSVQFVSEQTDAVLLPLERALEADALGMPRERSAWVGAADGSWREALPLLSCLVSHGYTAEITDALTELRLQSGAEFRQSCLVLREKLIRLREMDRPALGNIF